ncbi:hypothetical protein GGS26DRAFT_548329 [Hypomontagnella submonticulosa]|nr:hypothetical protein GGS26DRAFT_548329 [Hypomontagnella submonticulosa]
MVITCKFSKKTILIPGNTKYKAHHWAELAFRAFLLYDWGIPARAISDCIYVDKFIRESGDIKQWKVDNTGNENPQSSLEDGYGCLQGEKWISVGGLNGRRIYANGVLTYESNPNTRSRRRI